jgi:hypothetical protein
VPDHLDELAPPVTDGDLAAARELRGALYELVVALEAGRVARAAAGTRPRMAKRSELPALG